MYCKKKKKGCLRNARKHSTFDRNRYIFDVALYGLIRSNISGKRCRYGGRVAFWFFIFSQYSYLFSTLVDFHKVSNGCAKECRSPFFRKQVCKGSSQESNSERLNHTVATPGGTCRHALALNHSHEPKAACIFSRATCLGWVHLLTFFFNE